MDGKRYAVGFVVREDVNGRRYYDHELTEIAAIDGLAKAESQSAQTPQSTAGTRPSASQPTEVATANRESVKSIVRKHLSVKYSPDMEGRAAMYADSIVRQSQGSGATKDLARVQRGGDLLRLTTMFYSYFNTLYNLGARRVTLLKQHHGPKDIFIAANTALLLWFIPSVLSELAAGRGPDAEGEEPEKWAAMNLLQYPFQAVVGVRDIAAGVFGNYGYQITPAQSAPKSLAQWFHAVNKALAKKDAGELAKPTAEAVGYIFGLPLKQPIITVGNLWDYLTGEDPEFALRDLFFTKPKDRR